MRNKRKRKKKHWNLVREFIVLIFCIINRPLWLLLHIPSWLYELWSGLLNLSGSRVASDVFLKQINYLSPPVEKPRAFHTVEPRKLYYRLEKRKHFFYAQKCPRLKNSRRNHKYNFKTIVDILYNLKQQLKHAECIQTTKRMIWLS